MATACRTGRFAHRCVAVCTRSFLPERTWRRQPSPYHRTTGMNALSPVLQVDRSFQVLLGKQDLLGCFIEQRSIETLKLREHRSRQIRFERTKSMRRQHAVENTVIR